ncbi:MAG: FAD-dependent oxidoreductase [Candidatus Pacearchaeota archaeon]
MSSRKKLIILGAGLSGLAAGEVLCKTFDVEIYEKQEYIGGLASNFKYNGRDIPKYYHHIIKSNKTTLDYLKKFGNIDNLKWQKIKVAIGVNYKINTVNTPLELLKFKYLTLYEKLRFGLFGIYTVYFMNPNKIKQGLDAENWLKKYSGKAVTEKMFYQLYSRNKFNIPLNRISAKQFANRLYEKEIQDYFSFPEKGYQNMINNIEKEIIKNNGKIYTKSNIKEIDLKNKVIKIGNKKSKYDILINTIPFEELIKISKNMPENFKEQISKVKYCPAVGICFVTKKFLIPKIYWINLFNEDVHIIMQHSILNDSYGEKINWCLKYGGSEKDLSLSDEEIKEKYFKVIKKYFPNADILWSKVFKTKYGEPIYDIDYHKYMPDYKTLIDGLYFAGIQLTYPKIRNMNVALNSGIKVADIILKDSGHLLKNA